MTVFMGIIVHMQGMGLFRLINMQDPPSTSHVKLRQICTTFSRRNPIGVVVINHGKSFLSSR